MKYLFTFCLLCTFVVAQAQVSIGVLAGYNRSQEQYDVEVPDDAVLHIPSYHVSALMTVPLGKRFGVAAEAGFIQRGAACRPGFVGFDQDSELRLHYGQANVNVTFDALRWRRLTLSTYAGLGGSYLFSGNTTIDDLWSDTRIRRALEIGDRWRRFDVGANAGALVSFRAGCGNLLARVGAYRGFRHVDSENFSLSRDLLLSVGYAQSF